MAGIKHAFVNASAEGGDATKVRTSNWNADHTIDGPVPFTIEANIPSAPAAGLMKVYGRARAGRGFITSMGPEGHDYAYQPSVATNTVTQWLPGTAGTLSISHGALWAFRTNSGTGVAQLHPTIAGTNAVTSMVRATFGTGTTTTGSYGIATNSPICWRGDAAGLGGFYFHCRFALETYLNTIRLFIGLTTSTAALTVQPNTLVNSVGLIKDSADTILQLSQMNATTNTKTSSTCTPSATQVLDFSMYAPPNASTVTMRLVDAVTNTVYVNDVVLNTTLPVATAMLYPAAMIQATAGTTAKLLALSKLYVETDL